jgi:hypothetical protein
MAYEADLEKWCREQTTKAGGYLLKWVSPGNAGVPDRILLLPYAVVFLEFKTPKAPLEPLQEVWRTRILKMGHDHYVVRTREQFSAILNLMLLP